MLKTAETSFTGAICYFFFTISAFTVNIFLFADIGFALFYSYICKWKGGRTLLRNTSVCYRKGLFSEVFIEYTNELIGLNKNNGKKYKHFGENSYLKNKQRYCMNECTHSRTKERSIEQTHARTTFSMSIQYSYWELKGMKKKEGLEQKRTTW